MHAFGGVDALEELHDVDVVEQGEPERLMASPEHHYTRTLMDSMPQIGVRWPELETI